VRPARENGLQGFPVDLGIIDEVHIVKKELYSAMSKGLGGRLDTALLMITTAGDNNSELLLRLMEMGAQAMTKPVEDNSFGFFVWESPETVVPGGDAVEYDKLTKAEKAEVDHKLWVLLTYASPSVASGRRHKKLAVGDVRDEVDPSKRVRYDLNRQVSSVNGIFPLHQWYPLIAPADYRFPKEQAYFAIDRDPGENWATVTMAIKVGDKVHGRTFASIEKPTTATLLDWCVRYLAPLVPHAIVLDGWLFKDLARELRMRGFKVRTYGPTEMAQAARLTYEYVAQKKLQWGDYWDRGQLISYQIPLTVRKNRGEAFYLSRNDSSSYIDGIVSLTEVVHAAANHTKVEWNM
jgi:hypothetical protein